MSARLHVVVAVVALFAAAPAAGSPNVPLDDPSYLALAQERALGRIPLYTGGVRPLTEARVRDLMLAGGASPDDPSLPQALRRFWFRPFQRAIARFAAFTDDAAPYSTPLRPELMIGSLAVSCEYQEGRPCGNGAGIVSELDSSIGYGRWVSAFTRVLLPIGSANYQTGPLLERGYVNVELGPVALEGGRDVLVLGPGARAQMMVGENAAPLDMVRISTSHPLKIPRIPVAVEALAAVVWLRDPQTYHNTNLTILRGQLDLFDQFELGGTQLLQIEGEGAPHLSFGEAIAEHFTRKGLVPNGSYQQGLDYSNRRLSFDTTYTMKFFHGARVYYELAFEDIRKAIVDAWVYDGDHLAGLDMPVLTRSGKHGITVEYPAHRRRLADALHVHVGHDQFRPHARHAARTGQLVALRRRANRSAARAPGYSRGSSSFAARATPTSSSITARSIARHTATRRRESASASRARSFCRTRSSHQCARSSTSTWINFSSFPAHSATTAAPSSPHLDARITHGLLTEISLTNHQLNSLANHRTAAKESSTDRCKPDFTTSSLSVSEINQKSYNSARCSRRNCR